MTSSKPTSKKVIETLTTNSSKKRKITLAILFAAVSLSVAIEIGYAAALAQGYTSSAYSYNQTVCTGKVLELSQKGIIRDKGFRIVLPNKVGAWDFRSFTFAPDQIVVNQGDKVTLHFIGVLGVHHIITVDGVGTFSLHRGEIHTVSFIANNPGTINFFCSVHLPNMVGQILVLPKSV